MQMLVDNRECLERISEYLYQHETITGKEFMRIFREIKGIPEPEEESGKKSFMEQALEAEGKLSIEEKRLEKKMPVLEDVKIETPESGEENV